MDYKRDYKRKLFCEGGYGRRDLDLEPLIFLIFPEVSRLRLRGHTRCLFITAILSMKYYRDFNLFTLLQYGVSLVVKGCFES